MRFPNLVRPLEDDEVDRFGVEAQQCVELTNTNRSRAYPTQPPKSEVKRYSLFRLLFGDPGVTQYGGLAQLGEHLPYKQRVGGSIPSASTIYVFAIIHGAVV